MSMKPILKSRLVFYWAWIRRVEICQPPGFKQDIAKLMAAWPSLPSIGNISIKQWTIKHSSAERKNQENSVQIKILNLKREYTFQIG